MQMSVQYSSINRCPTFYGEKDSHIVLCKFYMHAVVFAPRLKTDTLNYVCTRTCTYIIFWSVMLNTYNVTATMLL